MSQRYPDVRAGDVFHHKDTGARVTVHSLKMGDRRARVTILYSDGSRREVYMYYLLRHYEKELA